MPEPTTAPGAQVRLVVTTFETLYGPGRWTAEDTDWHTWASQIAAGGVRTHLSKDGSPLIGLYELRPGGGRSVQDVLWYYGVALDFDGVSALEVEQTAKLLEAQGVSYLWHTTWSHGLPEKGECRRVLIPLAAPVAREQYRALMALIRQRLAPRLDQGATQLSQAFYLPSCPADRLGIAECYYHPGKGLDPRSLGPLLEIVEPPPDKPPEPCNAVQKQTWERVAKQWVGRKNPHQIELGQRLQQVLDGVRFAQAGERDSSLWRLVTAMIRTFPDATTESLSDLFAPSLHRMGLDDGEDALTDRVLREKIERARDSVFRDTSSRYHPDRQAAMRQAFGNGRASPYTDAEIAELQESLGVDADQLRRLWVLQHGREYYVHGPAGLRVCQREDFDNVVRVLLAPAPIDLHVVEQSGRRQLTRAEVLEAYSTPLEDVRLSLTAQMPAVDLVERTLTLPACPLRALEPRFDPQIDQWLRHLAGPLHGKLLDWLSHVPDLARPLVGLVLTGPKSAGKSMLGQGVSRLWTKTGPTDLANAMGHFNGDLLRCPYLLADEGSIPRDSQGRERTEDLRQLIQETTRAVNRKMRDLVPLDGAVRLQISANNDDVLALGAALSVNDVDAIAARFLHVQASEAAAHYLEGIGGWDTTTAWVDGDGIACHVAWLHRHARAAWEGRFGVSVQQSLVDRMLVRNGIRAQLCELFLRSLRDDQPLADGAEVRGGELYVQIDWVMSWWETILRRSARLPTTSGVIKALDGLAVREDRDGEGWFRVQTERLIAWGEDSGTGDAICVLEWISKHDKHDKHERKD